MGKLVPLVLLVLLIGTNYQEARAFSFGNILSVGSIVKDVIDTVGDVVGVFIPQKLAPDHSKKYKQFENDLAKQKDKLADIRIKADDAKNRTKLMEEKLGKNVKFFKEIEIGTKDRDIQVLDMLNRIDDVVKRANFLTYTVTELLSDQIRDTASKLDIMDNLDARLKDLHEYIVSISSAFEDLMERVNEPKEMSNRRFAELLKSLVSYQSQQPRDVINKIKGLFDPGETSTIYGSLLGYFTKQASTLEFDKKCDMKATFQDQLKSIYNMVMITESRAFLMRVVSYKYAQIQDPVKNANVKNDINLFIEDLISRAQQYIKVMKSAFENTPSDIMRCDPPINLKDATAFEMNNLFANYYVNIAQISKSCWQSCESIDMRRELECVDAYESNSIVPRYCPQFQCKGRIHNCKTADNHHFCEAPTPNEQRYRWIAESADHEMISSCDGTYVNTMTKTKCHSCLCQCSEEGAESEATRTISLLPQISDYENNMVVSNIRFQKRDNVVHIQIEQGELLPEGRITRESQSWVPLQDFVYSKNTPDGSLSMVEGNDLVPLIPNVNYTFMSFENRKMMLDDVYVDMNYVVTGVRFQFKDMEAGENYQSRRIYLQVHSTKFDYFTGQVLWKEENAHKWVDYMSATVHAARMNDLSEVKLEDVDDPMKSVKNIKASTPHQFVLFKPSDKSYGQVTVPFWDARAAGAASLTALSGVGMFHRGSTGFGGFISPKLLGMDHSHAMNFKLSKEKLDSYLWK